MLRFTTPRLNTLRITRTHKVATAVLVAAGATTAIAATAEPSGAQNAAAHAPSNVKPVATNGLPSAAKTTKADKPAKEDTSNKTVDTASVSRHIKVTATKQSDAAKHKTKPAANRSTKRTSLAHTHYANNLNGWIHESLSIMKSKGIPGSYDGLHRNIMRESSGNPNAVNGWDVNAINGVPSKGLLQVIQPTFDTYHVSGTANKLTDPVANITAAANYAAHRYGSIDNVNSAY